jgi:RNA polymerase sigma factor (sigma-70 family)
MTYREDIINLLRIFIKKQKEINKVCTLVLNVKKKYYKNTGINLKEIESELKVTLFESLKKFKSWHKENFIYKLLNYLDKTLYNSLQQKTSLMSLTEEDKKDNYNIELETINIPLEYIDERFIEEGFENEIIDNIVLKDFIKKLSPREKEVFNFRFVKDYTFEKTGEKMGIKKTTVQNYYNRILEKYRKHMVQKK